MLEQTHATPETLEYINKLLTEYAVVTITAQDGKVVYAGPVWGALGSADASGTMKNNLSLGIFAPKSGKNFTVELTLSPEMGNEYKELLGVVKWVFEASGVSGDYDPQEPSPPDTGVYTEFYPYFAAMLVSGILAVMLFKKRPSAQEEA